MDDETGSSRKKGGKKRKSLRVLGGKEKKVGSTRGKEKEVEGTGPSRRTGGGGVGGWVWGGWGWGGGLCGVYGSLAVQRGGVVIAERAL